MLALSLDLWGKLFTQAWAQSQWDWATFRFWGEALALLSLFLACFVGFLYGFCWLVVTNTKRQVNDMRHLVKLMREGVQKIKANAEKKQD